jgi:hypothetical protein
MKMRQTKRPNTTPKTPDTNIATELRLITVDYPQENETITSYNYTFRVSTPAEADIVEMSINNGPWMPCRSDVGYWWYDWSNMQPGKYQIRARMHTKAGIMHMTLLRRFQVVK